MKALLIISFLTIFALPVRGQGWYYISYPWAWDSASTSWVYLDPVDDGIWFSDTSSGELSYVGSTYEDQVPQQFIQTFLGQWGSVADNTVIDIKLIEGFLFIHLNYDDSSSRILSLIDQKVDANILFLWNSLDKSFLRLEKVFGEGVVLEELTRTETVCRQWLLNKL